MTTKNTKYTKVRARFTIRQLLITIGIASTMLGLNSLADSRSRAFIEDLRLAPSSAMRRHVENVPDSVAPGIDNETTLLDQFCLRRRTAVIFGRHLPQRADGGFPTEFCKMTFVTTPIGTRFVSEESLHSVTMWN